MNVCLTFKFLQTIILSIDIEEKNVILYPNSNFKLKSK